MINAKYTILALLPALLLVSIFFGIRVFQYRTIFITPTQTATQTSDTTLDLIPILTGDPIIGSTHAPHTIIAFEDFACAGCKAQDALLTELMHRHPGAIKIIWKGLPVATFPYSSEPAHEYAFCANEQNAFEGFKTFAFSNNTNLSKQTLDTMVSQLDIDMPTFTTCLASGAASTYTDTIRQLAQLVHIQHVPAFFIDNTQITTPSSVEEWERVLGI